MELDMELFWVDSMGSISYYILITPKHKQWTTEKDAEQALLQIKTIFNNSIVNTKSEK